jgi:hypothetical protein
MPRTIAWSMKLAVPMARVKMDFLPKLESGRRVISTPSRISLRGYLIDGSS